MRQKISDNQAEAKKAQTRPKQVGAVRKIQSAEKVTVGILATIGITAVSSLYSRHPIRAAWIAVPTIAAILLEIYLNIPKRIRSKKANKLKLKVGFGLIIIASLITAALITAFRPPSEIVEPRPIPAPTPTPLRGILVPANDPDPPNSCANIPSGEIAFLLGASTALTGADSATILRMGGQDMVSFERTVNGIYINAVLYDATDQEVARITKNVIRIAPRNGYYAKQVDDHTLFVLNPNDQTALYVRYLNPHAVKILGLFFRHGHPVSIDEQTSSNTSGLCVDMTFSQVLFDWRD